MTRLVNEVAFEALGIRNSCIASSAALVDVLAHLRAGAHVERVETLYLPETGIATILGSLAPGRRSVTQQRRAVAASSGRLPGRHACWATRKASPGGWAGHLVVVATGDDGTRWVADPSLSQITGLSAVVFEAPASWDDGRAVFMDLDGTNLGSDWQRERPMLRYKKAPKQAGWKNAPAFRLSQRRDIVTEVLSRLSAQEAPRAA